ncbi:uncharacterized protein PV07_10508 [Cladophialophora immunda]|uniref:EKC/KEOPS complex subunit BUD32 n=1 Tax=Cladophialophora immunda TaxID=569365 RepID=A0A0D2C0G1_9EURO|nr:uncharacterized protein PV07_10508 [Cladophialophora immunda]KIW24818.1 hypothetical protein PV07_10508 [Cladophialophora immunda]
MDHPAFYVSDWWILNSVCQLSGHLELFYITYIDKSNAWHRLTVTYDVGEAQPHSLEDDVQRLEDPQEKSDLIRRSIMDRLHQVQFSDNITRLHLKTEEGKLHVDVVNDAEGAVQLPQANSLSPDLMQLPAVHESQLGMDSHISGFVYRVRYEGVIYIKKEIFGQAVEKFRSEMKALYQLRDSKHWVQIKSLVLDQRGSVKALLLEYAGRGTLGTLLHKNGGTIPWASRCMWAQHIVHGIQEAHARGLVHGTLNLSHVVIDSSNHARIIALNNDLSLSDLTRKQDILDLGQILSALVEPCPTHVPHWYREIIRKCSSPSPQLSATDLAAAFPENLSHTFRLLTIEVLDTETSPEQRAHQSSPIEPPLLQLPLKYDELEELNHRGFLGQVYRARHVPTGEVRSLQSFKAGTLPEQTRIAINELVEHRHSSFVQIFECFRKDDKFWVAMENLEGCNLFSLINHEIGLHELHIARVSRDVLRALHALHRQGIVHRDVRSDNILLDPSGRVCLSGIDLCIKAGALRPISAPDAGWMAPEMIDGRPYDYKVDIWCVGITILEIVEGKELLDKLHKAKATASSTLSDLLGKLKLPLSESLNSLLEICLDPYPGRRPSAEELLQFALHDFCAADRDMASLVSEWRSKVVES